MVNNSAGQLVLYVVGGRDPMDQTVGAIEAFNYVTNSSAAAMKRAFPRPPSYSEVTTITPPEPPPTQL